MSTEDYFVVVDIHGIYTYHTNSDVLVFTYDYGEHQDSQIEVTEGYANDTREPPTEAPEDTPKGYSITPEFEQVLDYWNQFKN